MYIALLPVNVCTDFFDRRHIVESAKVIGKSRPKFGRLHLILIILATGVFSFQRSTLLETLFDSNGHLFPIPSPHYLFRQMSDR